MKSFTLILLVFISLASSSCFPPNGDNRLYKELDKIYNSAGVTGTFVLFDNSSQREFIYDDSLASKPLTPASTFKICNSLIGLETGVITDENFVITWDSVARNPVWDKDHDLKTAFRNSTVWYYQELARRVGGQRMKEWLDKAGYGNADTSGGIDKFWLSGGLRISALEQVEFLKKLHDEKLPFSKRSMQIVKQIMIDPTLPGAEFHVKTGWGLQEGKEIGWLVGYFEKNNHLYYFANCILEDTEKLSDSEAATRFDHARKEITLAVLKRLGVMDSLPGKK